MADIGDALREEYGFRCPACLFAYWLEHGPSRPSHDHRAKGAAGGVGRDSPPREPDAEAEPETAAAPAKPCPACDCPIHPGDCRTHHPAKPSLDFIEFEPFVGTPGWTMWNRTYEAVRTLEAENALARDMLAGSNAANDILKARAKVLEAALLEIAESEPGYHRVIARDALKEE